MLVWTIKLSNLHSAKTYLFTAREATRACTGQGSGGIIEVIWRCSGDEQKLSDCHQAMVGVRTCDHKRDAGVFCSG